MMGRIQVLSPLVANQIAAGEVVERPASVVKELVENALDAGATRIEVEAADGGRESIRIVDDGCGIAAEDCKNAFLRHATSKIATLDDLSDIRSLGFRGEALASIASVACVTLLTRPPLAQTGRRLVVEGGALKAEEELACAAGTSIEVNGLFSNVPARLKFLKAPRTEAAYIGEYIARVILARPDVAFRYSSGGRLVYSSAGDDKLLHAIRSIYGAESCELLLPVEYDNGYLRVTGYIGTPELSKPNRNAQSFFVNGRCIRSNALSFALGRAYDNTLMSGRFAFAVLELTLASREVDVNVHPAKTEVRFADESKVTQGLYAAVKRGLVDAGQLAPSGSSAFFAPAPSVYTEAPPAAAPNDAPKEAPAVPSEPFFPPRRLSFGGEAAESAYHEAAYSSLGPAFRETSLPNTQQVTVLPAIEEMTIVGCAFETYWLVTRGDELFLIDQHAAHERRLYEKLISRELSVSSQRLLIPRSVRLTPLELESVHDEAQALGELGFLWTEREDAPLTLLISAFPLLNGKLLDEAYLREALTLKDDSGKSLPAKLMREKLMQTACKHAVKAGDVLTKEEILSLLTELKENRIPLTCPHGRPVVARMTRYELERMFKRIV